MFETLSEILPKGGVSEPVRRDLEEVWFALNYISNTMSWPQYEGVALLENLNRRKREGILFLLCCNLVFYREIAVSQQGCSASRIYAAKRVIRKRILKELAALTN
jgi:hypothetical protein